MSIDLKPCPFCGGIPKLRDMSGGQRVPPFDVICVGKIGDALCQCHLWPVDSAEEAVMLWNTRHEASKTEQPDGCREAFERDKAKYYKEWSDKDCPVTGDEDSAYKAGWHDCLASMSTVQKPQLDEWGDKPDQWSEHIAKLHPTVTGKHKTYEIALEMVGNRHSKGELVDLVNWLLVTAATPMRESSNREKALEHEYVSTRGLWCIDRDPKEVTHDWIKKNAFQLKDTL